MEKQQSQAGRCPQVRTDGTSKPIVLAGDPLRLGKGHRSFLGYKLFRGRAGTLSTSSWSAACLSSTAASGRVTIAGSSLQNFHNVTEALAAPGIV